MTICYARAGSRSPALALTTALTLLAFACGGGSSASPTPTPTPSFPNNDYIGLFNSSPTAGSTLSLGQAVTLSGLAAATLRTADSAVITMIIQDQSDRGLQPTGSTPTFTIARGDTQITVSQTITLPSSGVTSMKVTVILTPAAGGGAPISSYVTYTVQ